MNRYAPKHSPTGALLQAGIPFGPPATSSGAGILLRGVVVATYVYDDPDHPFANQQPAAIYCDVLVYTQMTGGRTYMVRGALVTQEFASIQSGVIHKPRAATQTISGASLDPTAPIDVSQLDGDHVLLGFVDDRRAQAIILRAIPPPHQGIGNEDGTVGQRMRLILADGDPLLFRHHGVLAGFTDDGSYVVDASGGNSGAIDAGGREVPSVSGGAINLTAKLSAGVTHRLVDPAGSPPSVTQTLGRDGFDLSFTSLPGRLTLSGASGSLLSVPGPGGTAAQIGGGVNTLVSTLSLVAYINTRLIPWVSGSFMPSPAATPPPLVTSTTLANPSVLVP